MDCRTDACDGKPVARGLCRRCYRREPDQREKQRKHNQAWAARNPEKVKARQVRHRGARRAYAQAHPEEANEASRRWKKEHPEVTRVANQRRRARRASAPVNDFTLDQWMEIRAEQAGCCFYCGRDDLPLTQEHKIPLIRGGNHTKDNIVGACQPCNSKKGTKTADEFEHADDRQAVLMQVRSSRG